MAVGKLINEDIGHLLNIGEVFSYNLWGSIGFGLIWFGNQVFKFWLFAVQQSITFYCYEW